MTFTSCKKDGIQSNSNPEQELKFLTLPKYSDLSLVRIAAEIGKQNKLSGTLIEKIVRRNGFPKWEKAAIVFNRHASSLVESNTDTIIYIPLAIAGESEISAFFIATLNNYVSLQLYNKFDYEQFGFDTVGLSTANKLAVQFMILNHKTFGNKDFIVHDLRLLKSFGIPQSSLINERTVHVEPLSSQSNNTWETIEYQVCTTTRYLKCNSNGSCCPDGSCYACIETGCWKSKRDCRKVSILVFVDDNNQGGGYSPPPGNENGGGSYNPNSPQLCNPDPLIINGLPPCPKGITLGWAPLEVSEHTYFDYSNPPFSWEYNGDDGTTYTDPDPQNQPDFEFDASDNYETLYPRFTNMVKNLKTFVKENPDVMNALQKWSGFTKQQIIEYLTFGQGPKIKVEEMTGRYAWYKKKPGENTLRVRASYVRGLEAANLEQTQKGTAFLLAVSILHEFIHLGTHHNNISEGKYDFGLGFERDAFNVIVEDTNANEVVIKFSEYF